MLVKADDCCLKGKLLYHTSLSNRLIPGQHLNDDFHDTWKQFPGLCRKAVSGNDHLTREKALKP